METTSNLMILIKGHLLLLFRRPLLTSDATLFCHPREQLLLHGIR